MTTWLLDLGNTRLKVAAWRPGEGLGEVQAWTHGAADFAPSMQRWLAGVQAGDTCWLASVAGSELTAAVAEALASHGNPASAPVRGPNAPACALPTRSRRGWAWTASWRCWRRMRAAPARG